MLIERFSKVVSKKKSSTVKAFKYTETSKDRMDNWLLMNLSYIHYISDI